MDDLGVPSFHEPPHIHVIINTASLERSNRDYLWPMRCLCVFLIILFIMFVGLNIKRGDVIDKL